MTTVPAFRYPGAWTGSTANMPQLTALSVNSILVNGSLVLVDPNDANLPWAAGAPASGALLPNLAWDRAAPVVGGITAASQLYCPYTNLLTGTSESIFERSAKGGLHGIVSQVNSSNTSHFAMIRAAPAIEAYINANPNHSYYLDIWENVDRLSTATAYPIAGIFKAYAQVNNYGIYLQSGSVTVAAPAGGDRLGFRLSSGAYTALGIAIANIAESAWTGTLPASDVKVVLTAWGNVDAFGSLTANKAASKIFYGMYLEDLTVSGRSYATVDAIRFGQYTTAFTTGGEFYGDTTPTAPSALP